MGTAALTIPTTAFTLIKKKMGNQLMNQDNLLKLLLPLENAGDPTNAITPDFVGQICVDTTNAHIYGAKAATSADWIQLG